MNELYQGTTFGTLNEPPRTWRDETIRKTVAACEHVAGDEVRVMLSVELTDADFDASDKGANLE